MTGITTHLAGPAAWLVPLASWWIKAGLIALLGAVGLYLGRRLPAVYRSAICRGGIAAILVLPLMALVLPSWNIATVPGAATLPLPLLTGITVTGGPIVGTAGNRIAFGWPLMLFLFWAIGAAAILSRSLIGWYAARRIVRRGRAADADVLRRLTGAADPMPLCGLRIVISDLINVPFVCGVFRPVLVLPASALEAPDSYLRQILIHEITHVRRHDIAWGLAADIALALHWFNPLVHLVRRRLILEAERVCDDCVLLEGFDSAEYAENILAIARRARGAQVPGAGMARRSNMEGRIMAILNERVRRDRVGIAALTLMFLLLFATVGPISAMQLGAAGGPVEVGAAATKAEPADTADDSLPGIDDFVKVTEPPQAIFQQPPKYPEHMIDDHIEGRVWIAALIDSTGAVRKAVVRKSSGAPTLDSAALAAAPKCRYKPAMYEDKPVACWITYKVEFKLDGIKKAE